MKKAHLEREHVEAAVTGILSQTGRGGIKNLEFMPYTDLVQYYATLCTAENCVPFTRVELQLMLNGEL